MTILRRPDFWKAGGPDGRDRLGHEFGYEYRGVKQADVDRVKSRKMYAKYADARL